MTKAISINGQVNVICMVECLPQACSNVHILFAGVFAASMQQQLRQVCSKRSQEAVLKWAWECLLQACRRPHLYGKMFAASLRQVCCMLKLQQCLSLME